MRGSSVRNKERRKTFLLPINETVFVFFSSESIWQKESAGRSSPCKNGFKEERDRGGLWKAI